ncbi:MAG: large-conductance mechanosensitive channel protein MscL [Rubricoccaceae bacterium]|nr:large-conductance mechanosensitive channel protein MscL [Rubricoccaceae bacterium]
MWQEFKEFAVKGSVVDMAVGIIIGAAFGTIVTAFVEGILMPPLGLLLGGVDFTNIFTVLKPGDPPGPYDTLEAAQAAGAVVMQWGVLVNTLISFLIVALAVFLFVKWVNGLKKEAEQEVAEEPVEPELTADQQLLTEIRDLLQRRPV